ncbi:hypothetical protein BpHYR1_018539, partial [Brachionus plicatilis]
GPKQKIFVIRDIDITDINPKFLFIPVIHILPILLQSLVVRVGAEKTLLIEAGSREYVGHI